MNISLCVPRPSGSSDIRQPTLLQAENPTTIPPNSVLLKVDRFGFSANNVTYQMLGEHPHFRYFDFHPVPSKAVNSTHGLVPVWGFATVENSSHSSIVVGERVYGYFAPSRYLLLPVSPTDVNKFAFYVPRPHLPADRRPYNQILRCSSDPQYSHSSEDITMLYRPLFWTSYWCEDWLHTSKYYDGVSSILISSASSKTAFCLAYALRKRRSARQCDLKIIGFTSRRNLAFSRQLCLYDQVLLYDDVNKLDGRMEERWIYVDVAGNPSFNSKVNDYFASPYTPGLAASVTLGMSNTSPADDNKTLRQDWGVGSYEAATGKRADTSQFWPKVEYFFLPEWLNVRKEQLGIKAMFGTQAKAWKGLVWDCMNWPRDGTGEKRPWVEIKRIYGAEEVKREYEAIIKNQLGPEIGFIWSLWDDDERQRKRMPNTRSRL